jgi:hypothetical protein
MQFAEGSVNRLASQLVTDRNAHLRPHCAPVTYVTGMDLRKMVGATGFEPATPCAQGRCATRLRYAPTDTQFTIEVCGASFCRRCSS